VKICRLQICELCQSQRQPGETVDGHPEIGQLGQLGEGIRRDAGDGVVLEVKVLQTVGVGVGEVYGFDGSDVVVEELEKCE